MRERDPQPKDSLAPGPLLCLGSPGFLFMKHPNLHHCPQEHPFSVSKGLKWTPPPTCCWYPPRPAKVRGEPPAPWSRRPAVSSSAMDHNYWPQMHTMGRASRPIFRSGPETSDSPELTSPGVGAPSRRHRPRRLSLLQPETQARSGKPQALARCARAAGRSSGTGAQDAPVSGYLAGHSPSEDTVRILPASEGRSPSTRKPRRNSARGRAMFAPAQLEPSPGLRAPHPEPLKGPEPRRTRAQPGKVWRWKLIPPIFTFCPLSPSAPPPWVCAPLEILSSPPLPRAVGRTW